MEFNMREQGSAKSYYIFHFAHMIMSAVEIFQICALSFSITICSVHNRKTQIQNNQHPVLTAQ